jgi:hypothetical protein
MAKDKPTFNKPTKAQLQRYDELKKKKRELDAQVSAIEKEMYPTHELILEYLETKGVNAARLHKFELLLTEGQSIVKWKEEFIRVTSAEKAAEISAAAPRAQRLEVRPPASSTDAQPES